jgi:hypothetical protein
MTSVSFAICETTAIGLAGGALVFDHRYMHMQAHAPFDKGIGVTYAPSECESHKNAPEPRVLH